MAILAAATGNKAAVEQRAQALTALSESGALPAGSVVPTICYAALAFAQEDYAGCARLLDPVAADVVRIGGSHAQREIIEDTFVVALIRSGNLPRARTLLDQRLHRRPSPRDVRWRAAAAA